MKKQIKKLRLETTKLRVLTQSDLGKAGGGYFVPTHNTCFCGVQPTQLCTR